MNNNDDYPGRFLRKLRALFTKRRNRNVKENLIEVSPTVRGLIHSEFNGPDVDHVLEIFSKSAFPMIQSAGLERVHVAILILAEGDIGYFESAVDTAMKDWRDTLTAAGLANENWREVMAKEIAKRLE